MMKNKIAFWFFVFAFTIVGQQFKVTDDYGTYFSYDKYRNELYYSIFSGDSAKKINLTTQTISKTKFSSVPIFFNNEHKIIYYKITDTSNIFYSHDFANNITKQLYESFFRKNLSKYSYSRWPLVLISPDDTHFLHYDILSIEDSTWNNVPDSIVYKGNLGRAWSSDTSFIFYSQNNALAEYDIITKLVDTLTSKEEQILNFTYNLKNELISYSTGKDFLEEYLYIFDMQTRTEKIIYSPQSDIYCSMGRQEIRDMAWSPNGEHLVFMNYDYTNPGTGINIFDINCDKVEQLGGCLPYGLKKQVIWPIDDSIFYAYGNDGDAIYGYNLYETLTEVENRKLENLELSMSNYPNPFNSTSMLSYSIPERGNVEISVYNSIGEKVEDVLNETRNMGKFKVNFEATNLSSGIYYYVLRFKNYQKVSKMVLLK